MRFPQLLSLAFFAVAALLMGYGLFRAVRFFIRHGPPWRSLVNPLQGFLIWTRLPRRNSFGPAAEPERRAVFRVFLMALGSYGLAVLIVMLTGGPGTGPP